MIIESEGGDAAAMVSYFMKMPDEDPNFFHVERIDETDKLKDVMWVDARSRAAYKEFSDVVCFDTTYLTSKYKLIFGNFVEVNHHGQSAFFGCALLSHEDSETLEWLFSTWLECMAGKQPGGFLIDQCAAMRNALKVVMLESRHRWCLWHILQKFPTKLGNYAKYDEFKDVLNNIVYDSLTESEFEANWESAIQKYSLQECDWLTGLFSEREMLVPSYMKHIFWAGMKTTQRSESINNFFDNYVKRQTTLHEFAPQYFAAIEARTNAEEQADANCERKKLTPVTDFRIELEFQTFYTSAKFHEFQNECRKILYVHVIHQSKIAESLIELSVLDRVYYRDKNLRKDCSTEKVCQYTVTLDEQTKIAWCSCKLMECHGIMCRHLISVFVALQIPKLPPMFILDHWRKDIERPYTKIKVKYHDHNKTEEVFRIDRMQLVFDDVVLVAAVNEDETQGLIDILERYLDSLVEGRASKLSSKEGDNAHLPLFDREAIDADVSTKGSKEGENTVPGEGGCSQCTPVAVTTKKRPAERDTPSSVKKPSATPSCKITPGAESVGPCAGQTGGESEPKELCQIRHGLDESLGLSSEGITDSLGIEMPSVTKDPFLPKNPPHRPIESRYKSVVELNTTSKGKTTATVKPKKLTAKQQLQECTFNSSNNSKHLRPCKLHCKFKISNMRSNNNNTNNINNNNYLT